MNTFIFDAAVRDTPEVDAVAQWLMQAGNELVVLSADVAGTPAQVVNRLQAHRAKAYWSSVWANVEAARNAGFSACWVGNDDPKVTTLVLVERLFWGLRVE